MATASTASRYRKAYSSLNGIFPIVKPKGMYLIDMLDQVQMCMEFDLKVRFTKLALRVSGQPLLRKHEYGLLNIGIGNLSRNLLNFQYGTVKSKLFIKLGERAQWTIFSKERQERLGVKDDMNLFKPYDHVTQDDVVKSVESFVGEIAQYRAPKERIIREILIEKNIEKVKPREKQFFKEPAMQKKSKLYCINGIDFSKMPIIILDITSCGKFCRERFAYDFGLKLNTYAKLESAFIYQFCTITIDDSLETYDLEWSKIKSVIGKTSQRYCKIFTELETLGKPISKRFNCPW